ncbi:MAG: DUF6576 domain-containing protein [Verrucomicrobiota bacterium]
MPFGGFQSYSSRQPLFYLGNIAFDATTLLIAIHIISMLLCTVVLAFDHTSLLGALHCNIINLSEGFIWTPFTYSFVHYISTEHIWFAIEMLMFWWFGREVEAFISTKNFGWLYALLIIVPAFIMVLVSVFSGVPYDLWGSKAIHFSIFLGFAIIYPNAMLLFNIPAKWIAIIFLSIYSLAYLAQGAWLELLYTWTTVGTCYLCLKASGVRGGFNVSEWLASQKEKSEVKKFKERERAYKQQQIKHSESVDAILEKISQQGINSLSDSEKATLEKARAKLFEKDKGK